KTRVSPSWAASFIEDWASQSGDDCIGAGARTAYFHGVAANVGGTWQAIRRASFSPNFRPDNNEICANYYAGAEGSQFLMSSGGDQHVGSPMFGDSRAVTLP